MKERIRMEHFRKAMERVKPSVTDDIEKSYEAFGERYPKRLAEEATRMHY